MSPKSQKVMVKLPAIISSPRLAVLQRNERFQDRSLDRHMAVQLAQASLAGYSLSPLDPPPASIRMTSWRDRRSSQVGEMMVDCGRFISVVDLYISLSFVCPGTLWQMQHSSYESHVNMATRFGTRFNSSSFHDPGSWDVHVVAMVCHGGGNQNRPLCCWWSNLVGKSLPGHVSNLEYFLGIRDNMLSYWLAFFGNETAEYFIAGPWCPCWAQHLVPQWRNVWHELRRQVGMCPSSKLRCVVRLLLAIWVSRSKETTWWSCLRLMHV